MVVPRVLLQVLDLLAHPVAQRLVQVRDRLVEKEDCRLTDNSAGDRYALLLAVAQFRWEAVEDALQVYDSAAPLDTLLDLGLSDVAHRSGNAMFSYTVRCG